MPWLTDIASTFSVTSATASWPIASRMLEFPRVDRVASPNSTLRAVQSLRRGPQPLAAQVFAHKEFSTLSRVTKCRTVVIAVACLAIAGCGGGNDDEKSSTTDGAVTETQKAAAISLQQAMDAAARSIDVVRGTRDSLERMGTSLQPQIAQTGDVIGLLTPKATAEVERLLLNAAREQRSFLQFAADSTSSRSATAANSATARARDAGRRASSAYSAIAQAQSGLAGLLPASTTFNTGRLRDAVRAANATRRDDSPPATGGGTTPPSTSGKSNPIPSNCGDGLSVNSVTTCPFARNVRDAYQDSGGSNVINVYSPVTKITYTMTCTDGVPVVCRGGNGAVVTIR